MKNEHDIKRYTSTELDARRAQNESMSDLTRVRAKSEAELERDIAADADFRDVPRDWYVAAEAVLPPAKTVISLRLDADVVDWFRQQGPGYQTRINAVLRAFVDRSGDKNTVVTE